MGWLKAAQTANRIHSHNGYQPLDSHRIHTVLIVVIVVLDINPCLWWNQWIFAVDSSETCFVCLRNPRKQRFSFLLRSQRRIYWVMFSYTWLTYIFYRKFITWHISAIFWILNGVFYRFEVSCQMFIATFMGPFQMTAVRRSGIVKCHGRNSCLRTCKYRPHFTVRQGGTHVKLNVRVVNFPFWPHASVLDGWNAMGLTQEGRR